MKSEWHAVLQITVNGIHGVTPNATRQGAIPVHALSVRYTNNKRSKIRVP
jgi:hypothetical protein